jgi:Fur family ferric uptake transcriptional regulator
MKRAKSEFERYLERSGLRATAQRSLILDVFLKTERHLTAEELYRLVSRKDPSVGQATVYRTLRLLVDSGVAREVDFGDGMARYEHGFGHEHHDHLICIRCRKSIEVMDGRIEKLQERLAAGHGFTLTGHTMDLFGLCRECRGRKKS